MSNENDFTLNCAVIQSRDLLCIRVSIADASLVYTSTIHVHVCNATM